MNLTSKNAVAAIILVLGFATPVVAGLLEDADAAIKRHDYATALRLIRPLAERNFAFHQVKFLRTAVKRATDLPIGP
jgi:hypothetical protein